MDTADVQTLMMPGAWERLRAAASQAIHGGERYFELELQARRADGALRWYALCAEVLRAPGGVVPEKILGVLSDVTGRKEIEQTRELLLQELEHRIKNTLAIVSAIASQTLRGDIAAAEARKVLDGRFSALAAAHELLTRHHWRDMSMQQVVEMALAPHHVAGQIGIEGPGCPLSPKRALALTLALHELATNAVKYGALSCPEGRVSVGWARDGKEKLVFTWRESGGPAVTAPQQRGFGSQIAERVLAAEFAGKVSLDFAAQGLTCTLAAPLQDALSAG
jgi:two-component sensor histidine kinase